MVWLVLDDMNRIIDDLNDICDWPVPIAHGVNGNINALAAPEPTWVQ